MSFTEELSWYVRFGWAHARAALGSAEAAHNLGRYYETTQTDRKDMSKAVLYYMKAANKGYFHAQWRYAYCFVYGEGVEKDPEQAVL